jgi:hypothetical protein
MTRLLAPLLLLFLAAGSVQSATAPFLRDEAGLFTSDAVIQHRVIQAARIWTLVGQSPLGLSPAAFMLSVGAVVNTASTDATQRAEQQLESIRERFHRDLVIVTLKELPPEESKGLQSLRRREINRRLAAEARARAEAAGVEGVFVQIGTDPGHVAVVVWPDAQERVFTYTDAQHLRQFLVRRLHAGGNDKDKRAQVLLEAIGQVRSTFEQNRADIRTLPANEMFLAEILVALIVAWVVLLGVRRRLTCKPSGPPEIAAAGWQTRLGTPAGAWVADRAFLAHSSVTSPPVAAPPPLVPGPAPATVAAPPP